MAKARDIPGLHADAAFAEAAAATVAVRAEELFEHSAGVLDMEDIERVHDMRVASRRLRAVLEIFAPCFPADRFKPVLREVKALADALGERRDPDVLLDRLAQIERALPKTDAPGVEAFADPVRAQQLRGNEVLAEALDTAERSGLRSRLQLLAASAVEPPVPEAAGAEGDEALAQAQAGDEGGPAATGDGATGSEEASSSLPERTPATDAVGPASASFDGTAASMPEVAADRTSPESADTPATTEAPA